MGKDGGNLKIPMDITVQFFLFCNISCCQIESVKNSFTKVSMLIS